MVKMTVYEEIDFTLFVVEPQTPFCEWMSAIESCDKEGGTKFELFDIRNMTIAPTENDLKDVLMYHQKNVSTRPTGSKTAFVVGNLKDHRRVRVYDTLTRVVSAPWETRAFFSIEEARVWLGIKLPPALDIVSVDVKRNRGNRGIRPPAK